MTDMILLLAFIVISLGTVACSAIVATVRNVLHAAVALFFALTGVAALYILLAADFLAGVQILVYAGGVVVLLIFGIFMTSKIYLARPIPKTRIASRWTGIGLSMGLSAVLIYLVLQTPWRSQVIVSKPSTALLGDLLLSKYLLPFEMISLLLLFALVGAVVVIKNELGDQQ